MTDLLQRPEYLHVLLNPLPVYGLAMGVLALVLGLFARSKPSQIIALILVIIAAASAWPVFYYGHAAHDIVHEISNEEGEEWLHTHMHRAETFIYVFYATAFLAISALIALKKFPKAFLPLAVLTLVASLISLGIGGWISQAGGKIRHPEFRDTPRPHQEQSEEHTHH